MNEEFNLLLNNNKVGSLYKGKSIFSPKFLIPQNDFIDKNLHVKLELRIKARLKEIITRSFWDQNKLKNIKDKNMKAIWFSLNSNLGVLKKQKRRRKCQ